MLSAWSLSPACACSHLQRLCQCRQRQRRPPWRCTNSSLNLTFPDSPARSLHAAVQSNEVYPTPSAEPCLACFRRASDKRFPLRKALHNGKFQTVATGSFLATHLHLEPSRPRCRRPPSLGARCILQAAAHLVDRVYLHWPVRQWALLLLFRCARCWPQSRRWYPRYCRWYTHADLFPSPTRTLWRKAPALLALLHQALGELQGRQVSNRHRQIWVRWNAMPGATGQPDDISPLVAPSCAGLRLVMSTSHAGASRERQDLTQDRFAFRRRSPPRPRRLWRKLSS